MRPLMERIALLKQRGLTGQMVVAKYLRQSVAPLQEHSRPMWTLINLADDIRLSKSGLSSTAVDAATCALFGGEGVEKPAGEVRPLYKWKQSLRDVIQQEMPPFDAKGLVGVALPQEDDEEDMAPRDDRAGDTTSQAGAAHEVIVLDGDEMGGGRPP